MDIQGIAHKLRRAAADFGMPFEGAATIYNSRHAQELSLWAETKKRGNELHSAIFKAYFVYGQNISSIPMLSELASSVGLSGDEASEILKTGAFKAAVDEDWDLAGEMRVTAVPTVIMNQDRLVGAYPYSAFERLMESNGIKKK